MTFGGTWYCYTLYTTGITASYSSISGNACEKMQPGSSVIKFTDKDRECGFINGMTKGYSEKEMANGAISKIQNKAGCTGLPVQITAKTV